MSEIQIATQNLPNGITSVVIKGLLDAYTYSQFKQAIDNLFEQNKYKLIVNMSNVGYISTAGAGVFIGAIGIAKEKEGNIVIIRPNPAVKEVFDILGVSKFCQITDNMESALKIFV